MNTHAKEIIRELEHCLSAGVRSSDIFDDWLDMVHATLEKLPDHLRSIKETGQPAEDNPEVQKQWERLRNRYKSSVYFERFSKAFAILMQSTEEYKDTIGDIYMEFGWPSKGNGQFFTPFSIASMMAAIHSQSVIADVHQRIKDAVAGDPLSEAFVMVGSLLKEDQAEEWFFSRILPLVAGRVKPVTVNDPSCGSGVMFLALASQLPSWMTQMSLVVFSGQDIDMTCVKMAQVNMMLYGLNGFSIRCASAVVGDQESVPIEIEYKQNALF